MNPEDEFEVLREQTLSLEKAIGDIDHEIGYSLPMMDTAAHPDVTVSFLRERYEIRGSHLFTLGKVTAQIEELERLVREQSPDTDREAGTLGRYENRLDWLDVGDRTPEVPSKQGPWQEPDHEHR